MNWHWENGNRICEDCGWLVIAEKFYYWCIGCEGTQDKHEWFDKLGITDL